MYEHDEGNKGYMQQVSREQRMVREKAVYRYTTALASGDIDTLVAVLQEAEHDPILEQMVLETHEAYEEPPIMHADEVEQAREMLFTAPLLQEMSWQESQRISPRLSTRLQRFGTVARTLAAVLIVCALLGSFLLLFAAHHPGSGMTPLSSGSVTWKAFSIQAPGPSGNNLNSVAVVSTNDVWAVGGYSNGNSGGSLVGHWNGKQWSRVNNPIPAYLYGVGAVSSTDVWAVGFTSHGSDTTASQTLVEHWNGREWSGVNSPNSQLPFNVLYSITAISASDAWAVGISYSAYSAFAASSNVHALLEHWDGRQWNIVNDLKSPSNYTALYQIKAVSANDIWAVGSSLFQGESYGSQALIEHWNGKRWDVAPSPSPGSAVSSLYAVTAASTNDIWVVGVNSRGANEFHTLVEHWNGNRWSIVGSPNPGSVQNYIFAVTARSANDVWATGYFSNSPVLTTPSNKMVLQTLVEHWDGKQWSLVKSPGAEFGNIWFSGMDSDPHSGDIWLVGFSNDRSSQMMSRIVLLN